MACCGIKKCNLIYARLQMWLLAAQTADQGDMLLPQCRQKTIEVKAKCTKCTLHWCPRCLLNRYGEEVAKVPTLSRMHAPAHACRHTVVACACAIDGC